MKPDLDGWGGRLGALADFEAPAGSWQAVLAARAARKSRSARRWPVALAAAVMTATLALAAWLQATPPAPVAHAARSPVVPAIAAGARAESERLEQLLARLPERRTMRGSTAFTVAELEDRLALLDDRLSHVSLEPNAPERAERLWKERVDVLNSLVQVRYADTVGIY